MRIYSMTATFGKLEHQTLTFDTGLNVIEAPNEWGKSTWCAFLVCMLYGIDTRERTKGRSIADKERYAPWSGAPMSGRMDISWNGRDITIERRTKGRSIFGDFQAYETGTGLPIPELTAANCGEVLLGVEKSVFTRAGFIKLTDMPVSDDEALRRRLNALVTTGDESGASDALEQKLRDLKNRCRYNRSGLLPQAEAQRSELSGRLQQLQQLREQQSRLEERREMLTRQLRDLENHNQALAFEASREDARRVEAANAACLEAQQRAESLSAQCAQLPSRDGIRETLQQLEQLQNQWEAIHEEVIPPTPEPPTAPAPFAGMDGQQALTQANSDTAAYEMLCKPATPLLWILAGVSFAAAVALLFFFPYGAIPAALIGIGLTVLQLRSKAAQTRDRAAVASRYGTLEPAQWLPLAQSYADSIAAYNREAASCKALRSNWESRTAQLRSRMEALTDGSTLSECMSKQRDYLAAHEARETAEKAWCQAKEHAAALAAVAKVAQPPEFPDTLTWDRAQTATQLSRAQAEHQQLQHQMGQCQGQMEALGQESTLRQQLDAVQARIDRLEDIYAATVLAMQTLGEAASQLQRKFAPRISNRAQELFGKLTGQRYDRLLLGEDLSVQAGARDEDTLRSDLWRSDGTADQLYLALRLAVAEELTPGAPLVLDDALVRFDDTRLALAMEILKAAAADRQVILFSCQDRERKLL